jgi:hypothetical protein
MKGPQVRPEGGKEEGRRAGEEEWLGRPGRQGRREPPERDEGGAPRGGGGGGGRRRWGARFPSPSPGLPLTQPHGVLASAPTHSARGGSGGGGRGGNGRRGAAAEAAAPAGGSRAEGPS